jgi:tetratricopeptide (TPR) repeat protein
LIKIEKIEKKEDYKDISIQLNANVAACYLKLSAFERVVEYCTKVLEVDDKHIKCYFRRSQAYESLEKYEDCLKGIYLNFKSLDLKKINEIEPENEKIKKDISRMEKMHQEKQQKDMEKMFSQLKDLGNTILSPFGKLFQLTQRFEHRKL